MTVQEYIQNELTNCAQYALTDDDQKVLGTAGIEEFIYKKLTSKKFRKYAISESAENQVRRAITISLAAKKPLQFRFPFGGYKLWHIPTAPEIDWAEFLSVAYYAKYLAPITAAYNPGIELIFSSDDMIIERMDNVPIADTDAYYSSFKKLLNMFSEHFPTNFKMGIIRIGDLYEEKNAMETELSENLERIKKEYALKEEDEKMIKSSELNIQWKGVKDLSGLSEEDRQQIIGMGPIYHHAYSALSKRKEFNRGEDKIVIFTTVVPNAIAIGTTKTSVTKFWTGFGVLEENGKSFKARILAPSQLDIIEDRKLESVKLNLFDIKNLSEIVVVKPI